MIVPDANLLIYAVDADSNHHVKARRWLEASLSGTTTFGLAWIVTLAFIRVTTRPGILRFPLAADDALAYIDEWLARPFVVTISPGERHWPIMRNLLQAAGTGGNLTSDAHLAALAIEQGGEIHSADHDFKRFPGLIHVNPLDG